MRSVELLRICTPISASSSLNALFFLKIETLGSASQLERGLGMNPNLKVTDFATAWGGAYLEPLSFLGFSLQPLRGASATYCKCSLTGWWKLWSH